MNENLLLALLGQIVTLFIAIGGWVFAYRMHNNSKRIQVLEKKIVKLENEVRSRIALEKSACDWLAEVCDRSSDAIKRELRTRTQKQSGLRPKMSPSDLDISLIS